MSKPIIVNKKTICNYRSGNKSMSDFHGTCYSFKDGLGGIQDEEVDEIWGQTVRNYNEGLTLAATARVEGEGDRRHLHVSEILAKRALSSVSQQRYEKLIDTDRLHYETYINSSGTEVRTCTTVKTTQPKSKMIENFRAYRWLSYSVKEMADGFNDIATFKRDVDFTTCKSIGVFDFDFKIITSLNRERADAMAEVVFTSWQKKCAEKSGTPSIISFGDYLPEQVRNFCEKTNLDLEWIIEDDPVATAKQQAVILTKMVLNRIGKKRYSLAKTFFAGKKVNGREIWESLVVMKPTADRTSPRYEQAVYEALEAHMARKHKVKPDGPRIQALLKENKRLGLKVEKREKICKGLVVKYEKLKRTVKDKGIMELIQLQKKFYTIPHIEGNETRYTRQIPFVEAMDLDVLVNDVQDVQHAVNVNANEESDANDGSVESELYQNSPRPTKKRKVASTKKTPDHIRQDVLCRHPSLLPFH